MRYLLIFLMLCLLCLPCTDDHQSQAGITFTGTFRLAAGSAAIDHDLDLTSEVANFPGITLDIDGKTRGTKWDIGCSEYVSSGMNLFRRRAITW